jgi:hypothetical protein
MMKSLLFLLAFILGPPLLHAGGWDSHWDELFQWGEYDSLERALEPHLREEPGFVAGDRARALVYLGVARHVLGRPEEADQAFLEAIRLDTAVRPDRLYVSREIAVRFQAIAAKERERVAANRLAPPPSASARSPADSARRAPEQRPVASAARKPGIRWAWYAAGAGAVAVAAGTVAALHLIGEGESGPRAMPEEIKVTEIDLR